MNMDKNVLHYLKSDLVLMTETSLVLVQSHLIETLKHLRPALIFLTEARDLITQKSKELSKVKDVWMPFSAANIFIQVKSRVHLNLFPQTFCFWAVAPKH